MGKRPEVAMPSGTNLYSLERINNNGNYEPTNCKWATRVEQRANQRPRAHRERPARPARASASKYIGVSRIPAKGRWLAKVNQTYVGIFRDECDAATAYNFAAIERWGDGIRLNIA